MEHARLISIAQKVIHKFGKDRQLTLCCAVYSRAHGITLRPGQSARSIRGRGVIKEIRYSYMILFSLIEKGRKVNTIHLF